MAVCTFATLADPAGRPEGERRVLATLPFLYFLWCDSFLSSKTPLSQG